MYLESFNCKYFKTENSVLDHSGFQGEICITLKLLSLLSLSTLGATDFQRFCQSQFLQLTCQAIVIYMRSVALNNLNFTQQYEVQHARAGPSNYGTSILETYLIRKIKKLVIFTHELNAYHGGIFVQRLAITFERSIFL